MIENLGWEVGGGHDFIAGASALTDGLEDFGLDVGVANEMGLPEVLVLLDVIFGEELKENVRGLGVGKSALLDEFIATLRVGVGDVARDGKDGLALIEGVSGGIKGAGTLGGFDYDDDIGETGDEAVAVEKRELVVDATLAIRSAGQGVFRGGCLAFDFVADPSGAIKASFARGEWCVEQIAWGILGEDGAALLDDSPGDRLVGFRENLVNGGAEYCHSGAAGVKTTPMSDSVDAESKTRDDNDAPPR